MECRWKAFRRKQSRGLKSPRKRFGEVVTARDRFLFYWSGHGDQRISADGRAFGFLPLADEDRWNRWPLFSKDAPYLLTVNES
jgi:hypothetical protein